MKQVPDQLRSGGGGDEQAQLRSDHRRPGPEPLAKCSGVRSTGSQSHHRPRLGLPSRLGCRPGPSPHLCRAQVWVRSIPDGSLAGYAAVARPGAPAAACAKRPQHSAAGAHRLAGSGFFRVPERIRRARARDFLSDPPPGLSSGSLAPQSGPETPRRGAQGAGLATRAGAEFRRAGRTRGGGGAGRPGGPAPQLSRDPDR